jgi:hypothetical protein
VSVPAVEGERTDARPVRPGEKLGRRTGGFGEIGIHLPAARGARLLAVHAAGAGDGR